MEPAVHPSTASRFILNILHPTLVLFLLVAPNLATAATWRWTGQDPSSSAWTRPQNWDVLSAPVNDGTAALVFGANPASARHDPFVDVPWELATIELAGDDAYSISGSRLSLRGGMVVRQSIFGLQHRISSPVLLLADNLWSIESSGATLISTGGVDLGGHRLELVPDGGTTFSLEGGISGAGELVKDGSGTLRLSGNNTYTGGTTLLFGVIRAESPHAIPPGVVTLKTGILDLGSSGNVLGPGASSSPGVVLGGVIGGSVSLNGQPLMISTLGDWILYDATNGPSECLISGTVDLASSSGSRIIRIQDTSSTTEELTILASIVNPASVPGATPAIRKLGPGQLILAGLNTFARALQVEEGTVQLQRAEAIGASAAGDPTVVLAGAALELASSFTVPNETLCLRGSGPAGAGALHTFGWSHVWGGPVILESDAAIGVATFGLGLRLTGSVSGSGGLTKVDEGTLVLTAANAYQGATVAAQGVLRADNVSGNAIPGMVTVADSGTLAGDGSIAGAIQVQAGGQIDPSASGAMVSSLAAQSATFAIGSTLHLALVSNGSSAQLDLLGSAAFAGRLELVLEPHYNPAHGDAFTLVRYASKTGEFTDLALPPLAPGLQWSLITRSDALVARVVNSTDVTGPSAWRNALLDAVPSPFDVRTRIRYEIARQAHARIEILDVQGRIVNRLMDTDAGPGSFEIEWTGTTAAGRRAANGVYFARLTVNGRVVPPLRRLVFVR